MSTSQPVLSICIPTFNRQAMLAGNLPLHCEAMRGLGMPFEIVVADNGSTDGTQAHCEALADMPELRYFRRGQNFGFMDNYAFAMRRANGKYALFLGDDDQLIPEKIGSYVARLEADAELGMLQAPWLMIDERDNREMGPFYHVPPETRFPRGAFAGLSQFIFDYRVFPEFFIIRREILQRGVSSPTPFIFWAYLFTARALTQADVLFVAGPFARQTAIHKDPKLQQGNSEAMFQWDRYRGGLEYIASLANLGHPDPLAGRAALAEKINGFMLAREHVSLRLHMAARNYPEAYIVHHRMAAYGSGVLEAEELKRIRMLAAVSAASLDAGNYGASPAIALDCISNDLLDLIKPDIRARVSREKAGAGNGRTAYLRLDPNTPAPLARGDAVFEIGDYLAQFV